MYRVVIVEDEPMISMLNRKFTERDNRFQVVREFGNGAEALKWLLEHPADLLVLDVYMPVLTGLELLRQLRSSEVDIDVIMVTAAHDSKTLDSLLKLGVTDYLVKPFTVQRYQQALDAFCRQREAIAAHLSVNQSDIDRLLHAAPAETTTPKGLQEATLERICQCLRQRVGNAVTCEEVSLQAGLSIVTVRRYVTYLTEQGQVDSQVNYDTGGRPSMLYRWIGA